MTAKQSPSRLIHCFLAALALLASLPSYAWNGAGHRLVAAIAWEQLAPETREAVTQLLRQHPDYARWTRRAGDADRDRDAFIESSTWPDDIRKDQRFYSAGREASTPPLPGYPDMERRSDWHYVNIPLGATSANPALSGQIDRQLMALPKVLESSASAMERAYALPWLVHLVGDAHQPLHTSVKLNADGRWDKLGNSLEVSNPFNSRRPVSTLHTFWDDLPGPSWLRGERLNTASAALIATHPRPAHSANVQQWIEESWRLARDKAYPPGNEDRPTVSEAFYENSREIANQRIVFAGYRLADLLEQALSPKHRRNQR